ncbi:putative NBD/HSP70 family sugar kinase [Shimia abyssi]|uniref:Putative NBD/HSP70 family sugar kinase n=2 Tax=Shimia abyssi TaxID=1662395 RepID=A0A2P8F7Q7_9RHOB|nr:putative NBD/HSP70 family sugar kinase [Shimia abyssi]
MTGLSVQTVSVISRELEEEGLIRRGEKRKGKVGQPSVPLQLAADGALFVGLEVEAKKVELILVNFVGDILDRICSTDAQFTPETARKFAFFAAEEMSRRLSQGQSEKISGIGITDALTDTDCWAKTWSLVGTKLGVGPDCPSHFGKEGSCACNAELIFGSEHVPKHFLYIHIGHAVSGGLAIEGHLHQGCTGNAGSIDRFPLEGIDRPSNRLSDMCSLDGLWNSAAAEGTCLNDIWVKTQAWGEFSDPVACWLGDAAPAIAQVVIGANALIDLPCVVIDGPMPKRLRKSIVLKVEEYLADSNPSSPNRPNVVEGSFGPDAVVLGAASLPLSKLFMLDA